ncbi:MAG: hypothetical protein GC160_03560 [Acidobacteria bacterium]|nr:hypothetical protein [Acidobacteriota bacterium]
MRWLTLLGVLTATATAAPAQMTVSPAAGASHQSTHGVQPSAGYGVAHGSGGGDARVGAGGIGPRTGNIVYPGTPGGSSTGSIVSPGLPNSPARPPNILHPGTPSPTTQTPTTQRPPVVSPAPPVNPGPRPGRGGRTAYYPLYFPIYGMYPYYSAPNVIQVQPNVQTQSSASHVIVVGDEKADATAPEPEAPADGSDPNAAPAQDPEYWLIALRGGLIYAAADYQVEPHALWFLTAQGDEYVVPLAEVDVAFSRKLNTERGVEINLDLP